MIGSDSDIEALLAASARSLFARHSDWQTVLQLPTGGWSAQLWAVVESAEFPLIAVPAAHGGSDGTARQWAIVLGAAARHSAAIPLAETGIAGWLLGVAGMNAPPGPLTAAAVDAPGEADPVVAGVPYGRHASALAVLLTGERTDRVVLLPRERFEVVREGENLAGEPRDSLRLDRSGLDDAVELQGRAGDGLRLRWAFVRGTQMAGALDALLEATTEFSRERVQFGTPIGRMPAVRERVVLIAEEAAAAGAAVDCAADAVAPESNLIVGAAKVRIGEAAGEAARLAHQVHGAIGTTREHPLHLLTTRLWAWREEGGNERWWSEQIGQRLLAAGAEELWPTLTRG
jgi:acyl-CoA dehydrogenase